jgi:hypothetical protein
MGRSGDSKHKATDKPVTHSLKFTLKTDDTNELILGLLELLEDGKVVNAYIATSGSPGNQDDGDWQKRGRGPIVPDEVTRKEYKVSTTPVYLPAVKGVEGNFYVISPHLVNSGAGQRGDFGIHFDANFPGSAGCIVLETPRGWQAFQRDMGKISVKGIKSISLDITYT